MSVKKLERHAYIRRHGTTPIPDRAMGDWMYTPPSPQYDTDMTESCEYGLSPASNLFPHSFQQSVQSLPDEHHDTAFSGDIPPWDTHGIINNRFVNFRTKDPQDTEHPDGTLPYYDDIDYEAFDPGAAQKRATNKLLDDSMSVLTPRAHESPLNFDPNVSTATRAAQHIFDPNGSTAASAASTTEADKNWNPNASPHTSHTIFNDAYSDIFEHQPHNDFSQMPDFRHLAHVEPVVRACFMQSPGAELDPTHRVCMLSKQVNSQQYIESNNAILRACTVGDRFKIAGAERVKWPVQMLIEATQGLRYNLCTQTGKSWHDQTSWQRLSLIEVAVEAGKLFLTSATIDANSQLPPLLHFFSPGSKYYQSLLQCRQSLCPEMYTGEPLNREHNNRMYATTAILFLLKCCTAMFAADDEMQAMLNICRGARETFPADFMAFTEFVMQKIDCHIQLYNEKVCSHHIAVDTLSLRVSDGTNYYLYTINAPKPWVLLQMLWLKTSDTNNNQTR